MMDEIAYCMTCGKKLPVPASGYVTHGGDDCIRKLKQDIARLTAEVEALKQQTRWIDPKVETPADRNDQTYGGGYTGDYSDYWAEYSYPTDPNFEDSRYGQVRYEYDRNKWAVCYDDDGWQRVIVKRYTLLPQPPEAE